MTTVERACEFADAFVAQTVMPGGAAPPSTGGRTPSAIGDYHLTRRLGSGGCGEVWQATAPGGLPKAIKILHGRFDGKQAETELRSLEKMRSVRHPFLLSIERIEIVDGRLIIVTELAENSLKDRFEELQEQGKSGIPRKELLGYLRDAADALDFLCEQHGLQHLDVKPANLLRQGNRIKVADFGVVRELDGIGDSPASGFTPLFASPELIRGRPCRNSDQYALAVVYQTLLTGQPPFAGISAAQVVARHLNNLPDISSLPAADQPAIARALSVRPADRFDSCRQFVDALCAQPDGTTHVDSVGSSPLRQSLPHRHDSASVPEQSNGTTTRTGCERRIVSLPRSRGNRQRPRHRQTGRWRRDDHQDDRAAAHSLRCEAALRNPE